jgi:hypothetical protein
MPALLLLSALTLSADTTTDTVTVSVTPDDSLTNLYFLYAQGDISRYDPLTGNAPADVTTTFALSLQIPFPIPGVPYFSLIGIYGPTAGSGVYVALDATDASNLVAAGTPFDPAFTSFSGFFSPGAESILMAAMQDPDGIVADGFTGGDIIQSFADIPEQQTPQLFTQINFTGVTDASLVKFSDATSGGTVEVSLEPVATPEPATVWLLGALLLLTCALARRIRKAQSPMGVR